MARKRTTKSTSTARRKNAQASRPASHRRLERTALLAALIFLAVVLVLGGVSGQRSPASSLLSGLLDKSPAAAVASGRRVGVISGHMGNDSGATCPDGRTEADTVHTIANRVARRLERAGATVDVLQEYDERLNGYAADALVSIHADSCIDRSGFKVARWPESPTPEAADRLVGCLGLKYGEATGLSFDSFTITDDMTAYHAFKRVAPQTAAAIIETGYMGGDEAIIGKRPDLAARGIADGVICYLETLGGGG